MSRTAPVPKICLAAACAVAALLIPLRLVPVDTAVLAVKHLGYWAILGTILLYLAFLWKPLRTLAAPGFRERLRPHLPALLVVAAATLFLHLHIERGFKILFDEHTLSSTAMSLHFQNRAFVQAASHMLGDEVIASVGFVDKRPILFPFAVSVLHNLTGYRPENVFWLNSGLTFLLLALVYAVTVRTCGRLHGILAVLLFTSLPLLAQNTNGGGYELLNLCIICGLVLSSIRYLERPGAEGLGLVILHSVLLANTRNESILYVLVPALLFLLKSWRERSVSLTWFAAGSPVLLILPLLSYRIFQSEPRFWQTSLSDFFNIGHLGQNLAAAAVYLIEPTGDYSNSILLSATGITALLLLFIHFFTYTPNSIIRNNLAAPICAVFVVVAATTFLSFTHFWGAWTDPMAARFSLPLNLFFALAVPFSLFFVFRLRRPPSWAAPAVALFIFGFTSPHTARLQNEVRMIPLEGYDWALRWAEENSQNTNDLYLADAAVGFGLYRRAGVSFAIANAMPERILLMKELRVYDNIYAFEPVWARGGGTFVTAAGDDGLNSRYVRHTVAKRAFMPGVYFRISKIENLGSPDPGNETAPIDLPPPPPAAAGPADFDRYLLDSLPLVPNSFR